VLTAFRADRRRLQRVLTTIQPDLVHGHGTEGPYALAAAESGRPALVSIQGIIAEIGRIKPTFRYRRVAGLEKAAVRQARFFTCRTAYDTGFVRALNPAARIFTIHEAVNPVFFANAGSPASAPTLLFVGSLVPWKGLDYLLEAVAAVRQACPALRLRVVGGGTATAVTHYRQVARQLDLEPVVEFCGVLTAPEIARLHRDTQVFVLPSQNDNSPNALAEAMVSGLPVVATRVGGIPSMIDDGQTGVLVPWAQPALLAKTILWLLKQPEERQRLGANARRVARERHGPENVASATVAAYKEILQPAGAHT
jgi:glycosyltransferase involved in cell wall biosynthesis